MRDALWIPLWCWFWFSMGYLLTAVWQAGVDARERKQRRKRNGQV